MLPIRRGPIVAGAEEPRKLRTACPASVPGLFQQSGKVGDVAEIAMLCSACCPIVAGVGRPRNLPIPAYTCLGIVAEAEEPRKLRTVCPACGPGYFSKAARSVMSRKLRCCVLPAARSLPGWGGRETCRYLLTPALELSPRRRSRGNCGRSVRPVARVISAKRQGR